MSPLIQSTLASFAIQAPPSGHEATRRGRWIRSGAAFLFLMFGIGCAAYKGLGVDVTNPLDGSGKITGEQGGVRVEGEGIGWTREMISSRVGRTYVTLRIRNDGPRRLLLSKNEILLGPWDQVDLGTFPHEMVRWPGGKKEKKITLDPGQDAGLRMYFISFSVSRRRDVMMRLRFHEDGTKDKVDVLVPLYLKKAPLRDPQEYHDYLKPSHPDFPRATPVSGLGGASMNPG